MSESRAIISRQPAGGGALVETFDDAMRMADQVAKSGLFACKNPAEALVKIVAGKEMGFGAIASMTDIHIIEGKPSPGANLIAAAIRRSGRYDYKINEHTDEVCSVTFFAREGGQMVESGVVRYTFKEAEDKGWTVTRKGERKDPWYTKPKNMLFARCITDGKRWHCPDVLVGVVDADEMDDFSTGNAPSVVVNNQHPATSPVQIEHRADPFKDPERPTDLIVNDDGSLRSSMCERTECCHRVEGLVRELGFSAEQMKKKLAKDYGGAESIHKLDLAGVQRLENELLVVKSKRLATSGTPASSAN